MRLQISLLLTLFSLSLLGNLPAQAQVENGEACNHTEAEYYRPEIVKGFDESGRYVLFNTETQQITAVLDDGILQMLTENTLAYGYRIRWGENCRYIFAVNHWREAPEPGEYPDRYTAIYDTITGQRIALWPGRTTPMLDLQYSPDLRSLIIDFTGDLYLLSNGWDAPQLLLEGPLWRVSHSFQWNMRYREFMVVPFTDPLSFRMYSLDTGALTAEVRLPDQCWGHVQGFYPSNGDHLVVYTQSHVACVSILNRNTGALWSIPTGELSFYERDQIAISPDGRYVVIGMRALRVWDLAALPQAFEDRQPIYRHEGPSSLIGSVQFIDNDTVETTSEDGVQRWNIITGEIEAQ